MYTSRGSSGSNNNNNKNNNTNKNNNNNTRSCDMTSLEDAESTNVRLKEEPEVQRLGRSHTIKDLCSNDAISEKSTNYEDEKLRLINKAATAPEGKLSSMKKTNRFINDLQQGDCLKKKVSSKSHCNEQFKLSRKQQQNERILTEMKQQPCHLEGAELKNNPLRKKDVIEKEANVMHTAAATTAAAATTRATVSSQRAKSKRSVRFGKVHVRVYEMVLGDNPSCSLLGPSLSIGWNYGDFPTCHLDDWEIACGENRQPYPLILTGRERIEMAMRWGFSDKAITSNVQAVQKAKDERFESNLEIMKLSESSGCSKLIQAISRT